MKDNRFTGLGVAMVTPFKSDTSIDFDSLKKLTEYLINGGVDFLVVLGTTGETPTISDQERYAILDFVIKTANKKLPIVAGFGGNDTGHILRAFDEYPLDGVDAILSVTPYYNRPNQAGLYKHYAAIAERCEKPIILYNVPSRTGANLEAETVINLATNFDNIVAVKEASGNIPQCMDILKNRPDDFVFLSGDDNITFPLMSLGGDGVISVIGNAYPTEFGDMVHLSMDKNWAAAQAKHYELLKIMQLIFKDGNPAGVKAILKLKQICGDTLRLPLANVRPSVFVEIEKEVEQLTQIHSLEKS